MMTELVNVVRPRVIRSAAAAAAAAGEQRVHLQDDPAPHADSLGTTRSLHGILFSSVAVSTIQRQCSRESRGCLLPRVGGRTDVQWPQIRLSGSELRVVESSRKPFPVW